MKAQIRLACTPLLLLGALMLTGCETSPGLTALSDTSAPTSDTRRPDVAPAADIVAVEPRRPWMNPPAYDTQPDRASFADANDAAARHAEAQTAFHRPRPDVDPHAALIGLYGELVGPSPDAAGQGDGASNMMQISFANEGACFNPDVDPTGRHIVFASTMHRPSADIYMKAARGQTITQITADPSNDIMPAFHPDGASIAFASDRSGSWDIYIKPIDGGQTMQLTRDSDHELHPSFSPDGGLLAYCKLGSRSGKWELWLLELDNPTTPRFLTYGLFPQFSPDVTSRKILFQRARQRGSRYHSVWTIDYLDGEARHPTEIVSAANAAVINPAWSPDGQRIVFVTEVDPGAKHGQRPAQSDLWVINLDGTSRRSLTSGQFANFEPVWADDGSVYFVSNRSGVDNIWAVATRGDFDLNTPAATGVVTVDPAQEQPGGAP